MGRERGMERAIVREKGWGRRNKKSNSEGERGRERKIKRAKMREKGVGENK